MDYYKGKIVVITGGSGGLGMALAYQLDSIGARLALLDIDTSAITSKVDHFAHPPFIRTIDIADEPACQMVFKHILDYYGKIDILINNAGITHIQELQANNGSIIHRVMQVNVMGSIYCTLAALDALKKSKGHIITLSSVAGFAPLHGRTAYSASKHALHGFFETLRTELKEYPIHVTMVCPSFIDTGIRSDKNHSISQAKTTIGQSLTPADAAEILLKGAAKTKRLVLIGKTAKLSYWVHKLLPRYYEYKMLKGLGKS